MGTTITIPRLLLSYLQLTEIENQKFQVKCGPALRAFPNNYARKIKITKLKNN